MDRETFIRKCEEHDWDYQRSSNIYYYNVEKELRYQLRKAVQENQDLAGIYMRYERL